MPSLGSTDGMGSGGLVTMGGLGRVDAQAPPTGAAIKVRDDPEAFVKSTFPELAAQGIFEPLAPSAIRNLQRVAAIPFVLAGLYGLLALLSVGQAVAASTRHAQRDLAVLRALGASGGWVGRAVHWQATLFTLSAMVIGIPIGVVVGRQIFRLFADNMGVVDAPALPIIGSGGRCGGDRGSGEHRRRVPRPTRSPSPDRSTPQPRVGRSIAARPRRNDSGSTTQDGNSAAASQAGSPPASHSRRIIRGDSSSLLT